MDMVLGLNPMEVHIQVIILTIRNTGKVNSFGQVEMNMKGNIKKTSGMEGVK